MKIQSRRHYYFAQNSRLDFKEEQEDWHGVFLDDFKVYAYSAFYDSRYLQPRPPIPHVVVIGVWENLKPNTTLYCALYRDSRSNAPPKIVQVSVMKDTISAYSSVTRNAFVVHCPVEEEEEEEEDVTGRFVVPSDVSLDINRTRLERGETFKVPVEIPEKPKEKKKFAICLKEVYDVFDFSVDPIEVNQLVEWVELNKLLGVDHIIVYNHSMGTEMSRVFRYYAEIGYVDVLSAGKLPSDKIPVKPARAVGLNDCLYRFMYFYDKMIDIDTDEFISSKTSYSYDHLFNTILQYRGVSRDNTSYVFRNQRYFIDDPNLKPVPGNLVTQYAVRHVTPELPRYRSKLIVDPHCCLMVSPHQCIHKVPSCRVFHCPPHLGVNCHYKSCSGSRKVNKPKDCIKEFASAKTDNSMTRFSGPLQEAVDRVLKRLNHTQ